MDCIAPASFTHGAVLWPALWHGLPTVPQHWGDRATTWIALRLRVSHTAPGHRCALPRPRGNHAIGPHSVATLLAGVAAADLSQLVAGRPLTVADEQLAVGHHRMIPG